MGSAISSPRYTPMSIENCPYKYLYTSISIAVISVAPKWKHPNVNKWMAKQNVAYAYCGIVVSHKKEWSTDSCYNMDEPWKHTKWKKPVTTGHLLYNSIYMKFPEWNFSRYSTDCWLPAARGSGSQGVTAWGFLLGQWKYLPTKWW